MSELRVETLRGAQIGAQIEALAALRIAVFRDWPYLYDGTLDYEQQYLQMYLHCTRSLVVLIWDGAQCVGASTALPLVDAPTHMQQPFIDAGERRDDVLYFGESVLLPAYRGRGLGVKFFALREAHARALGLARCAFCAVDRPADHPLKPADYVSNDAFWQRRGYVRQPQLHTTLSWQDIGEAMPGAKPMTFWMRTL